MAWYGTQPNAPCLAAAIIIAAYVAPGGLERAGGCGLGHLCMSRAYMRTCVGDSTWAIAHLVLRPVAVAAPEGPGEGRGGGGEVSPCTAVVSHWSLASGCKNGLINAPQVCSRGASVQPELEVASGQGKHSQHREMRPPGETRTRGRNKRCKRTRTRGGEEVKANIPSQPGVLAGALQNRSHAGRGATVYTADPGGIGRRWKDVEERTRPVGPHPPPTRTHKHTQLRARRKKDFARMRIPQQGFLPNS